MGKMLHENAFGTKEGFTAETAEKTDLLE